MHAIDTYPATAITAVALRQLEPSPSGEVAPVRLDRAQVTIGAGPTCSVRLPLAGVHPLHCVIFRKEEGYTIRRWSADTRLNGELFTEAALHPGDRLQLGPVELEVVEAKGVAGDETAPEPEPAEPPAAWPLSPLGEQRNEPTPSSNEARESSAPQEANTALAKKCSALEQELVKTRSLLTSLGEELLQAREAAAKQVSTLTLRIDELEGALQERENLLVLLQEALEQVAPPSAENDRSVDADRNSADDIPFHATATPQADETFSNDLVEEPEPELLEAGASTTLDQWGGETLAETETSDEREVESVGALASAELLPETSGDQLKSEMPEPDNLWGEFESTPTIATAPPAEPDARTDSDSGVDQASSALPAPSTTDTATADLWDVEKPLAEEASRPLWDRPSQVSDSAIATSEGESPRSTAELPDAWSASAASAGPEGVAEPSGEEISGLSVVPAASSATMTPDVADDPWSGASLWQTEEPATESVGSPPCEDHTENTGAEALWGWSGDSPSAVSDTVEPSAAGSHNDEFEAAGTAAPTSPIADEFDAPPARSSHAPVSFIEQYRHLLEEEAGDEPSCETPAVAATPVAPPAVAPASSQEDDDNIEAYMAKMMARLRGESLAETNVTPAAPDSPDTPPSPQVVDQQQPSNAPLMSLEDLKTAEAPERNHNMSALRDLANNSARHAIGMANSRRARQQATTNLLLALLAMALGGFLVWAAPSSLSLQMVAGLIGVAGAGLWGCRSLAFLTKARREIRGDATSPDNIPAPTQDPLPIDLPIGAPSANAAVVAESAEAQLEPEGSN